MKLPPMVKVKSSNIEAIGHNPQQRALFVRFKNGGMYSYADVGEDVYHRMLAAESPGKFHAETIKGAFKHSKH